MFYFQLLKSLTNTTTFTFWNVTHACTLTRSLVRLGSPLLFLSLSLSNAVLSVGFCAWFLRWLFKLSFRFYFEIVFVACVCIDFAPFFAYSPTHTLHLYAFISLSICMYHSVPLYVGNCSKSASRLVVFFCRLKTGTNWNSVDWNYGWWFKFDK